LNLEPGTVNLELLHLCDSLFPIGGFAYSDGLETATSMGRIADAASLSAWLAAALDDTIGRMEGPGVWRGWRACHEEDFDTLVRLDQELTALRPAASARRSSRAMGLRLLTTWHALHPNPRLERIAGLANSRAIGPVLPVAFAGVCACSGVARRASVEAFAYTRLAATVSAAMRLMPIGQTDAHLLLSRALERVPAVVDRLVARDDSAPESFTPQMDIATMTQQYLHSRLFRS
jgi:urease accessory protein